MGVLCLRIQMLWEGVAYDVMGRGIVMLWEGVACGVMGRGGL